MKNKIMRKIIGVFLIVMMIFPLSAFVVMAAEDSSSSTRNGPISFEEAMFKLEHGGKTPQEELAYQLFKTDERMEALATYVEKQLNKKNREWLTRENISSSLDGFRADLDAYTATIKDIQNGGDLNTAELMKNAASLIANICTLFGPYGKLAASALELGIAIVNLHLLGEDPTSEIAQMEDRLNQKIDEIQDQLCDIEEQIADLSD